MSPNELGEIWCKADHYQDKARQLRDWELEAAFELIKRLVRCIEEKEQDNG